MTIITTTTYSYVCNFCGQWDEDFRTKEGAQNALAYHIKEDCPDA